ncbi:hypothetical protein Tco_1118730 [Tanacetum coccineum]
MGVIPWVGDGGISGVSLSEELSVDERNGEVAGSGGKEIRRISAKSSQENAYSQFPIRRIHLLPYAVSMKITIQRYEDIIILRMEDMKIDSKLCAHSKGNTPIRRIGLAQ